MSVLRKQMQADIGVEGAFDIHQCSHCKSGRMRVVGSISLPEARAPPQRPHSVLIQLTRYASMRRLSVPQRPC